MKANDEYDHYIAVDWSIKNMAIARMTAKSNKISVMDVPSDLEDLKEYLKSLKGTKILTIEETTPTQWLYVELKPFVDYLLICDPYRNKLLGEGAKTDKIDASKLVQLLKANLLKEVYHSNDRLLNLRHLVSAYDDLVKAGVRLKNQRYSLLRGCGLTGGEKKTQLKNESDQWVLDGIERQIKTYEEEKAGYEKEFEKLKRKHSEIRFQDSLPGIGVIGAVKIVSQVVTPRRFSDSGHFLSYAGLIKLEKKSGMVSYGRKNSRYCRGLKAVYKTAALSTIGGHNEFNDYYEHLIRKKGYADYNARHKVARRLAILSLGIFKNAKKYERRNHVKVTQEI
jgi:transposase